MVEEITISEIMQLIVIPIITTIMGYLTGKGILKICVKHNGNNTNSTTSD